MYRINYDTKNEYYIIDTEKKYTEDTVPIVPFNREKSRIDNISRLSYYRLVYKWEWNQ